MAQIDYFFTPISPYTYLAATRLEQIAAQSGATIVYRPVLLAKLFEATGGVALPQRHESRQAYRLQDLSRSAAMEGLALNLRPAHFPTNPVPASCAIIAAQNVGGGNLGALCHGLCRAVWAEDRDIAQDDVIASCLTDAGFDAALASSGMLTGVDVLERNTNDAIKAGVFGSPSYVVGDQVFWGHDRLAHLAAHLG
ncbi:MAG: 2-hydroxychromene-2-carboxylate isomerase [Paracoccaceae bacterium]